MKPQELPVTPLVTPDGEHEGYVRGDGMVALFQSPAEPALREALRQKKAELEAEREKVLKAVMRLAKSRMWLTVIDGLTKPVADGRVLVSSALLDDLIDAVNSTDPQDGGQGQGHDTDPGDEQAY